MRDISCQANFEISKRNALTQGEALQISKNTLNVPNTKYRRRYARIALLNIDRLGTRYDISRMQPSGSDSTR